ncbi:LysR family transcriptional regulator [Acidithiobacillus sp. IBUN Pt1247-S3]|uniref:LysR family transcriptional regulator n=1 Tax=Acidithiobacillus sp. IBUN Pt1247-S3 TaxID=3166642 RepID=UPI0034E57314
MANHRLDPALLLIWAQAARSGNLHLAAEKLFLTQPAISHRLKQLQERVGEPLYHRGQRGIVPTPMGVALWRLGERLESTLAEAESLCEGSAQLLHGTLHIAASQSNAEILLPQVLGQFHREHPAIHLQVSAVNSRQARQLREGFDLIFVEDGLAPPTGEFWLQETLLETEIVLLLPPDHPWAAEDVPLPLTDLTDVDLVWREAGSGVRDAVLQATRGAGLHLPLHYEMSGLAAVREAVRAGLGLGFSSRFAQGRNDGLIARDLEPAIIQRFSLLYRRDANPATQAFLGVLRQILAAGRASEVRQW